MKKQNGERTSAVKMPETFMGFVRYYARVIRTIHFFRTKKFERKQADLKRRRDLGWEN